MTRKIFISYTQKDRRWAEWIAWQVEEAGHEARLQAWDFPKGSNFVSLMDKTLKWADVTMPLLSPAFFNSEFGEAEWTAAFSSDPLGHEGRLIPVRVRQCEVRGVLAPIVRIDLLGLDKAEAIRELVGGLKQGRWRPDEEPAFPPELEAAPKAEPAFPRARMIGVPHRNKYFTGREELLAELHRRLEADESAVLAQAAVFGLGGVGKTQTAIEYAHAKAEEYRVVLWAGADSEAAIGTSYLVFARELGLVREEAKLENVIRAVMRWLSTERGWLLVFDNADEPELLREYLPTSRAGGKVLLTSKAPTFSAVGIREPFKVEKMAPDDAIEFLRERTGRDEPDAARELAEELDFLPLALEQAGAYIEVVNASLAGYLASYRVRGLELLEKGGTSTNYHASIATTWSLSIERVREESPASVELLIASTFLAPDSIPIEIFTLGGTKFGGELAEALVGADNDPLVFWEVLAPLERYSLVERLDSDAFRVHRLTQKAIREAANIVCGWDWLVRVASGLNGAHPEVRPNYHWRGNDPDRLGSGLNIVGRPNYHWRGSDPDRLGSGHNILRGYLLCDRLREHVSRLSQLLEAYEETLDAAPVHVDELLGNAGVFSGDPGTLKRRLSIRRRVSASPERVQRAVFALAMALTQSGRKDEARPLLDELSDKSVRVNYGALRFWTSLWCSGPRRVGDPGTDRRLLGPVYWLHRQVYGAESFRTVRIGAWLLQSELEDSNFNEDPRSWLSEFQWLADCDEEDLQSEDQRETLSLVLEVLEVLESLPDSPAPDPDSQ